MGMVLKIALGLVLAYVIILIGNFVLASYALDQVAKSTNKILKQQQSQIKKQQQKRLNEKLHKEEQVRLEIQKKQQEQRLALTKDKAWFNWYKQPKGCNTWKSDDHMVECTNHKMRAKKQFNIMWAQKESM